MGSSNNYSYLVVDDKSKDAFVIDPANPEEYAEKLGDFQARGPWLTDDAGSRRFSRRPSQRATST